MNKEHSPQDHHGNEGVQATRRAVFRGGLALTGLGALSGWSLARTSTTSRSDVSAFLEDWVARAQDVTKEDSPNEDACVRELCAGLARLDPEGFPERQKITYDKDGMTSGPIQADGTFMVLQFDLAPGAVIRAHNHVGFDFVSYCVRGETRVRNFEPVADSADPSEVGEDLLVREVANTLLLPGRVTSLTRSRANIHWFQAGEQGARFLDFGIRFADPGDGPSTFSALDLDEEVEDETLRTFRARWVGNPYAK